MFNYIILRIYLLIVYIQLWISYYLKNDFHRLVLSNELILIFKS